MPLRFPTDANDQLVYTLDESAAPFLNTGVWGAANLTVNGSVTPYQFGKFDFCVKFPGSGSNWLWSGNTVAEVAYPITMSCWVYISGWTNYGGIVTKNYNLTGWTDPHATLCMRLMSSNNTGEWQWGFNTGGGTTWNTVSGYPRMTYQGWSHIGLTYDGAYVRAYCNGTYVGAWAKTGAINYGYHGPWYIGATPGSEPLNGYVDDVRWASVARDVNWFAQVWADSQKVNPPPSFTDDERLGHSTTGNPSGTSSAGVSDSADQKTTSGPGDYHYPSVGRGVSQDERLGHTSGMVAGQSDSHTFKTLGTTGLRVAPLPPTLPIGLVANVLPEASYLTTPRTIPSEMQSGMADATKTLIYGAAAADYAPDVNDADGRAFLGDVGVRDLFLYDATQDPWHTPGPGFYGTGRDGIHYYDGVACAYGDFGTLVGGIRHECWTTGVAPFLDIWQTGSPIRSFWTMIADNKVRLQLTNGANWESVRISSWCRWCFPGDFDISFQFENYAPSGGPTDGGLWMEVFVDVNNYFYVRRHYDGYYDKDVKKNGSWGSYSSVYASQPTSGRLRLVRSGTNVSAYYWNGSAWSQIGTTTSGFSTAPMIVSIAVGGTGGTYTYRADVFNFTINSGTVSNKAGWALEAAGTHRGSRSDFPEHALLVTTKGSLDIIDVDNNKLWMRFLNATGNALPKFASGGGAWGSPVRAVMRDGVLLVGYGGWDTDGGGIRIDYNIDMIQIARGAGSSVTGGALDAGGQGQPRDTGRGIIVARNEGRSYFGDHDRWQIPDYPTMCADLWFSGGYEYRAFATLQGLGVHMWRRWYMESDHVAPERFTEPFYATGMLGFPCRWCQFDQADGELFYLTLNGYAYSANKAALDAALSGSGGTIAPTSTVALVGANFMGSAALLPGKDLYVAIGDSVYYSAWPAAFSRRFGPVGSDATYPLLPKGTIQSLKYTRNGGVDYLLVGVAVPGSKILCILNVTTPSMYDQILLANDGVSAAVA